MLIVITSRRNLPATGCVMWASAARSGMWRTGRRTFAVDCMIQDVTIPAALIAGLVSFLSPCVLPLVPPYLIYLTGATIEHVSNDETVSASKRAVMLGALIFVLGFSTVFVALGASASIIGGLIRAWSAE